MSDITIKTNGQARELKTLSELPEAVIRDNFDYMVEYLDGFRDSSYESKFDEAYVPRFFEYRGSWYDSHEFERAGGELADRGWDGIQPESYFSAVLIKFPNDYEAVIVGYAHW